MEYENYRIKTKMILKLFIIPISLNIRMLAPELGSILGYLYEIF